MRLKSFTFEHGLSIDMYTLTEWDISEHVNFIVWPGIFMQCKFFNTIQKKSLVIFFLFSEWGIWTHTWHTMPLTNWATVEGRLIFHYIQLWQGVNWGITKQAVNIMVIWQSYYWLVFPFTHWMWRVDHYSSFCLASNLMRIRCQGDN